MKNNDLDTLTESDLRDGHDKKMMLFVAKDYYLGDINARRQSRLLQFFAEAGLCPSSTYQNVEYQRFPFNKEVVEITKRK